MERTRSINFSDLPDDQIQKIISYLDFKSRFILELVNKRCLLLVKNVWLDELKINISDELENEVWDKFYNEKPSLLDWNQMSKTIWYPIIIRCKNLMSVEFSANFVFSKSDIQSIVDNCPKLYEIKIPSVFLSVDALRSLMSLTNLNSVEFGETNFWNINVNFDLWTLTSSDYLGYQLYSANGVDKSNFFWHIPMEKNFTKILIDCYQNWQQIRKLQINIFKMSAKVLDSFIYISETIRNLKLDGVKPTEHKDPLVKFFRTRFSLLKLRIEFVNFGEQNERLMAEENILSQITDSCISLRCFDLQYYSKYETLPKNINFKKLQKLKSLSICKANFGYGLNFLQTASDLESLTLLGIANDNVDKIWNLEWGLTKLLQLEIKIDKTYFTIDNIIQILSTNQKIATFNAPLIATPNEKEIDEIGRNCTSLQELTLPNYYNPLSNQNLFVVLIEKIFLSNSHRDPKLPLIVKTPKNLTVPTEFQQNPIYVKILH